MTNALFDEAPPRRGRRFAVTLSVAGPPPTDSLARPRLDQHPFLPFAGKGCSYLADVLRRLNFALLNDGATPDTSSEICNLVDGAFKDLNDPEDLFILHVIGHSEVESHQGVALDRVWLRGPDGQRLPQDVGVWREKAVDASGRTLLVLDVGATAHTMLPLVDRQFNQHGRGYWGIGAADENGYAYGGLLTRTFTDELDAHGRELIGDRAIRDADLDTLLRNVVECMNKGVDGTASLPRQIAVWVGPRGSSTSVPVRDCLRPGMAVDVRAHLERFLVAETRTPTSVQSSALTRMTEFLTDGDRTLLVVTGRPGAGKSTLTRLFANKHLPELARLAKEGRWQDLPSELARCGIALIDARDQSVMDLARAIARQVDPESDPDESQGLPVGVIGEAIRRLRAREEESTLAPVIVVDGLDEALNPEQFVAKILYPLAWWSPEARWCRLLVLSRPVEEVLAHLRPRNSPGQARIALDPPASPTSTSVLRRELQQFLRDRLQTDHLVTEHLIEPMARVLADTLVPSGASGALQPLAWGEHLVAQLWLHHLRHHAAVPDDPAAVAAFVEDLPRDVAGLVRLNLRQFTPPTRAVAWALAFGQGEGFPIALMAPAAQGFAAHAGTHAEAISNGTVRKAFDDLAFYVRRHPDPEGKPSYRFFHPAIAEEVRRDAREVFNENGGGPE